MIKFFCFLIILSFAAKQMDAQGYCIDGRFDTYLFDTSDIEVISEIQYGEAINYDGILEQLKLDIYKTDTGTDVLDKKPLVIFIHGGSLVGGDKAAPGSVILANDYVQKGFVFAAVNYRLGWNNLGSCLGDTLSLELSMYRALQDTRASIRFLKEHADEYSIDTNYIFLLGNSVGCTLSIYAAYAKQENFPQYLYDALGSIDSSSNTIFNRTTDVQGMVLKAPGIQFPDVLNNKNIPMQFFHGTCDHTVPYDQGPLFSCNTPIQYPYFYGSWYLSKSMLSKNIPYQLYTNEGYDHEAANDDTISLYAAKFLKSILCDNLANATEYYRYNNGGCISTDEDVVTVQSFPNPFQDDLFIQIESAVPQIINFSLFNIVGQTVSTMTAGSLPPLTEYEIPFGDFTISNGLYILFIEGESFTKVITLYRQK